MSRGVRPLQLRLVCRTLDRDRRQPRSECGIHGGNTPSSSIARYATGPDSLGADPHQFQYQQTSQLDGRVNLLPILWWVGRDGSSGSTGPFSLIGSIPVIVFSNGVGNGFVPAGEYALGASTYKMFPNFAILKV